MNKKLYIRFFANKEDTIPRNSHPVLNRDNLDITRFETENAAEMVVEWMARYDNGKVDFVWLTNGI